MKSNLNIYIITSENLKLRFNHLNHQIVKFKEIFNKADFTYNFIQINNPSNKDIEKTLDNYKDRVKINKEELRDNDFKKLYQTFNIMTQEIQAQKNKIALTERYQAWEMVAKKLAHEIKNPLTPITLSLERIKDRYSKQINVDKADFEDRHRWW